MRQRRFSGRFLVFVLAVMVTPLPVQAEAALPDGTGKISAQIPGGSTNTFISGPGGGTDPFGTIPTGGSLPGMGGGFVAGPGFGLGSSGFSGGFGSFAFSGFGAGSSAVFLSGGGTAAGASPGSAAIASFAAASIASSASAAGLGSFNGGPLLPTTLITPVDQNQLGSEFALVMGNLLHSNHLANVSALATGQLGVILPPLPVDLANPDFASFEEISASLYKSAGQTPSAEPISVLSMSDQTIIEPGGTVTLLMKFDPSDGSQIRYRDPVTDKYVPVQGSTMVHDSMKVDVQKGTVEVILDGTSVPSTSQLTAQLPQPLLIASVPHKVARDSQFEAIATDATPLPGYLIREVKHNEVFIIARKASGFYYALEPSVLSQGTLSPGLVTVCDTGSLVSEREGDIGVLNGQVLFMVGHDNAMLKTPGAALQVPSNSSVLVEYSKTGATAKISMVGQKDNGAATLNTSIGRPLFVKVGKSLSVYQDLPVLKRLKVFSVANEEIPAKSMISKMEDFDIKTVKRPEGTEKFCKVVARAAEQPQSEAEKVVRGGFTFDAPVRMFAADRTIFSLEKKQMVLQTGELFLHTVDQMALNTEVAQLEAKSQSDVVVSYQPGRERVDVLSGPGLISIDVDGRKSRLSPGQEVIATKHALSQQMLFPQDGIARRRFTTLTSGETNISTCDFAIMSMLKNSPFLHALRQPHNVIDGLLRERLLKTACAVTFATSSRGKYFSR